MQLRDKTVVVNTQFLHFVRGGNSAATFGKKDAANAANFFLRRVIQNSVVNYLQNTVPLYVSFYLSSAHPQSRWTKTLPLSLNATLKVNDREGGREEEAIGTGFPANWNLAVTQELK